MRRVDRLVRYRNGYVTASTGRLFELTPGLNVDFEIIQNKTRLSKLDSNILLSTTPGIDCVRTTHVTRVWKYLNI